MKFLKKKGPKLALGLVLCSGMVLAYLPLGVYADTPAVTNASTAKIVANGLLNTTKGKAYQIIKATWDDDSHQPKSPQFVWANDSIATWVRSNYASYIGKGTDNSVTGEFKASLGDNGGLNAEKLPNDNGAATFYDKLAAAIAKGEVTGLDTKDINSSGTSASVDETMGGYLLLFSNDLRVYRPSVVKVYPTNSGNAWTLANTEAVIKSSSAADDTHKTADKKSVQIGDKVQYNITTTIPIYPANTVHKNYGIYDVLTPGLKFDADSLVVNAAKADGSEVKLDPSAYTVQDSEAASKVHKGSAFGVRFDDAKYADLVRTNKYVTLHISYTATATETMVPKTAYMNKAVIDLNNNPYDSKSYEDPNTPPPGGSHESPDTPTVYTYGVDVKSVEPGGETPAPGAEFKLTKKGDSTPIKVKKTGEGTYVVDPHGTDTPTADSNGEISITGLPTGEYELTETKAPNGDIIIKDKIPVKIVDEKGGTPSGPDGVVDENKSPKDGHDGYVYVKVTNTKGFEWPVTGGEGTFGLAVAGTVIVACGVVGLAYSRKRSQANN